MKALSVKQPWAWAIIHGGKTIENRPQANPLFAVQSRFMPQHSHGVSGSFQLAFASRRPRRSGLSARSSVLLMSLTAFRNTARSGSKGRSAIFLRTHVRCGHRCHAKALLASGRFQLIFSAVAGSNPKFFIGSPISRQVSRSADVPVRIFLFPFQPSRNG
jgi:hypothetical protein